MAAYAHCKGVMGRGTSNYSTVVSLCHLDKKAESPLSKLLGNCSNESSAEGGFFFAVVDGVRLSACKVLRSAGFRELLSRFSRLSVLFPLSIFVPASKDNLNNNNSSSSNKARRNGCICVSSLPTLQKREKPPQEFQLPDVGQAKVFVIQGALLLFYWLPQQLRGERIQTVTGRSIHTLLAL